MRQYRLAQHALEQADQVGVMLDGVELGQLVHSVIPLHVFRLRFDAESVQVGNSVCESRIGLDPTGRARNFQNLQAQALDDGGGEQPADEQIAVPFHASMQFGSIVQNIGRIKKRLHWILSFSALFETGAWNCLLLLGRLNSPVSARSQTGFAGR